MMGRTATVKLLNEYGAKRGSLEYYTGNMLFIHGVICRLVER
jgi:hypothetical protein